MPARRPLLGEGWMRNWSERLIVIAAGLVASAGLVAGAFSLDATAAAIAAGLPPGVHAVAEVATRFGKSDWLLIPSGIVLLGITLRLRRRDLTLGQRAALIEVLRVVGYVFLTVAATGLVVIALKYGFGVARPHAVLDGAPTGFGGPTLDSDFASFPSGHSTTMGALFMAVMLLHRRAGWIMLPVSLLIALSRLVVGAHYLSDIAAGWLLGAWLALAIAYRFADRGWLFSVGETGPPRPLPRLPRAVRHVVAAAATAAWQRIDSLGDRIRRSGHGSAS